MQNRNIHRFIYAIRHKYLTMNNAVIVIAVIIAISWAWASVGVVQRNYALQREIDGKQRQKQLIELETQNLEYEQRYYKSNEYLSLEVKKRLGLAEPGEKVLVLPPNSPSVDKDTDTVARASTIQPSTTTEPAELQQWINFLFGGNSSGLNG